MITSKILSCEIYIKNDIKIVHALRIIKGQTNWSKGPHIICDKCMHICCMGMFIWYIMYSAVITTLVPGLAEIN